MVNMKYTFFYTGVFSNWHKSLFKYDGIWFSTMEQYMMWTKAMLFGDKETAKKILDAKHPKEQKALGRLVKNFNPAEWDKNKEELVYKGLKEKFDQNQNMKGLLLHSKGDLVEASPTDRIWGIGFSVENAEKNIDKWGENLLGKLLTNLRESYGS